MADSLDRQTSEVLARWGIHDVVGVSRPDTGMMNETFVVSPRSGQKVVLRRHRRTVRDQIEFEHAVIDHAVSESVPTPEIIATPSGERLVAHGGVFYTLFAIARGHQIPRRELTVTAARSMGAMLAELDRALSSSPLKTAIEPDRAFAVDPTTTVAVIERLLCHIENRRQQTQQDRWATDYLRSKATWLHQAEPPILEPPPPGSLQLIHGDFLESNLFFDDEHRVVDVIDWDKARAAWPPAQIVRAFDLSLGMDPGLCRTFLDGYRARRPIGIDELDHAAQNWHHDHVHDHWAFEGIYLRQDDRLRVLLSPAPFTPFADSWADLRPALQ